MVSEMGQWQVPVSSDFWSGSRLVWNDFEKALLITGPHTVTHICAYNEDEMVRFVAGMNLVVSAFPTPLLRLIFQYGSDRPNHTVRTQTVPPVKCRFFPYHFERTAQQYMLVLPDKAQETKLLLWDPSERACDPRDAFLLRHSPEKPRCLLSGWYTHLCVLGSEASSALDQLSCHEHLGRGDVLWTMKVSKGQDVAAHPLHPDILYCLGWYELEIIRTRNRGREIVSHTTSEFCRFSFAQSLVVDAARRCLYVSDDHGIWRVSLCKSTFRPIESPTLLSAWPATDAPPCSSGRLWPRLMTLDRNGFLYVWMCGEHYITRLNPDSSRARKKRRIE